MAGTAPAEQLDLLASAGATARQRHPVTRQLSHRCTACRHDCAGTEHHVRCCGTEHRHRGAIGNYCTGHPCPDCSTTAAGAADG